LDDLLRPLSLGALMSTLVFSRATVTRDSLVHLGLAFGEPLEQIKEAIERAVCDERIAIGEDDVATAGVRTVLRLRTHSRARAHSHPIWDGTWVMVAFPDGVEHPDVPDHVRTLLKADRLGELRQGIWLRPDNLGTMDKLSQAATASQSYFPSTVRINRPRHMATMLWSLGDFARRSRILAETTESFCRQIANDPDSHAPQGWILMTALLTQIGLDPLLPPALFPRQWPGERFLAARRVVAVLLRDGITHQFQMDFPPGT
ncbi:MAG: hypothetical protein ACC652_15365, partial [Acidimicrobiales bacterium]